MERKAKLIKRETLSPEQLAPARRGRSRRPAPKTPARSAFEVTTEWLKRRSEETAGARETFAGLFVNSDPQQA
ncbi:MAG: hypothetical protein KF868_01670 [Acidobacteria bacterium]|nr:hypothetical protein [Acidobacteriota bacterium]MCW5969611.1 hypothetical protein [Blastocatellales bacterium]